MPAPTYMAALTLTQLIALTRVYLHEYETSQGDFWLDTSLTQHINSSYRYYMLLTERHDWGAFAEAFAPITVVANTTTYIDLPAEFMTPWALWWKEVANPNLTLIWKSPRFKGAESFSGSTLFFEDDNLIGKPTVRVLGNRILLLPSPTVNGVIIPEGIIFPPELSGGSSVVDSRIHPVIHPLIAQRAAFFALAEDAENIQNYTGLVTSLAAAEQNFKEILDIACFNPLNTETKMNDMPPTGPTTPTQR